MAVESWYSYGETGGLRYLNRLTVRASDGKYVVDLTQDSPDKGDPCRIRLTRKDAAELVGDLTKLLLADR